MVENGKITNHSAKFLVNKVNKRVQTIKFPQTVLCELDSYIAREQKSLCVLTFRVFRRRR